LRTGAASFKRVLGRMLLCVRDSSSNLSEYAYCIRPGACVIGEIRLLEVPAHYAISLRGTVTPAKKVFESGGNYRSLWLQSSSVILYQGLEACYVGFSDYGEALELLEVWCCIAQDLYAGQQPHRVGTE